MSPTRFKILCVLRSGKWHNVNDIARSITSTENTVLSQLSLMRNDGYNLESDGELNYRLVPDLVSKMLMSPVPMRLKL